MTPRRGFAAFLTVALLGTTLALIAPGCGKSSKSTGPQPSQTTTVSGVVKDAVSGSSINGASVIASSGASTSTDANGHFTIQVGVNANVRLDVTRSDYSLNQVVLNLPAGTTKALNVNLISAGTKSTVAVSSGGKVTDASSGASLSLPAGFVTNSGSVNVQVTGLDPTTNQIKALPGGLDAIDATGKAVYLKPVSFAEYTVTDQSGNVLQFNKSASQGANIELPIPASLRGQPGYNNGDPIECYVYDPSDGKWKTPVPGVVGASTVDGTTPVIKATIFHLSWYGGAPAVSQIACVEGTVTVDGSPGANVDIEAYPGGSTRTDANGHYQVQATANSTVKVDASVVVGTGFRTAEGTIETGASGTTCAHLDLTLGGVVPGQYEVDGFMSSNLLPGYVVGDGVFVEITVGSGTTSNPVTGAKVQIGSGNNWVTLTDNGSGAYALGYGLSQGGPFWLTKGAGYTLRCDFDNNGTWDATSTIVDACGVPVVTAPANKATVGKSFTVSWSDSGSGVGGYSPVYVGSLSGTAGGAEFATGSRTFAVGNGVTDPVSHLPNPPVAAGTYDLEVSAGDGPLYKPLVGGSPGTNVTGPNASGLFWSLATSGIADTLTCTGTPPNLTAGASPAGGGAKLAASALRAKVEAVRERMRADILHAREQLATRRSSLKGQRAAR